MANTTQPVVKLQSVLTHGDVSGRLQQLFNQGDLNAAKVFIDSIIGNRGFLFDPNEVPFDMTFTTPAGKVVIGYSGNAVEIRETKKRDVDADLPTRIKKGLAQIEEIERALLDNTMTGEEFKEAVEHLEPHVSEHYRLLLTHENQVYERKDEPAIRVEMHSGSLYAQEELEREKKAREDREAAEDRDASERTADEVKNILADVLPMVSLDEKVKQGEMILEIIDNLKLITDPMQMQMIAGYYANIGLEIAIVNGSLIALNAGDYHEQHVRNVADNIECQELIASKKEELDKQITKAILSDAPMSEVNALYAKKDEIELVAQEGLEEGKPHEAILADIESSTKTIDAALQPKETVITVPVPEDRIAAPEIKDEKAVEAKGREEAKQEAKQKCIDIITSGNLSAAKISELGSKSPEAFEITQEALRKTIDPEVIEKYNGVQITNPKTNETFEAIKGPMDDKGNRYLTGVVSGPTKGPTIVHRPGED